MKIITEKQKNFFILDAGNDDDLLEWYPSQVKGPVDDEVQEGTNYFEDFSFVSRPFF